MCLSRVLSRWARFAGRPLDLPTRLISSLRSFFVRLASTRSRPFSTSQTEAAQTTVQGTRFQISLALFLASQKGISTGPNSGAAVHALRVGAVPVLPALPAGFRDGACVPTRAH